MEIHHLYHKITTIVQCFVISSTNPYNFKKLYFELETSKMGSCCQPSSKMVHDVSVETEGDGSELGKVVISNEVIDGWSEYIQLFTNIGWKGNIPQTFHECKQDKQMLQIIEKFVTTKTKPSTIRTANQFMNVLNKGDNELCHIHLEYIQTNLDYQINNT